MDLIEQKLSDYVADFLNTKNIRTIFGISGGASLHLIHSIKEHPNLNLVCNHHEQSAAMAADGYARTKGSPGALITTSGPGTTNAITGICCSYYDSVPLIVITGQVSTFRMKGDTGVRQIGFQETPIVEIIKPVVKYAYEIIDPYEIGHQLQKAYQIAISDRPGPVLIDIPDNFQREIIDLEKMNKINMPLKRKISTSLHPNYINQILELIRTSKRPIIIGGWGIHLSKTEKEFIKFVEYFQIPVLFTWAAKDILPYEHSLNLGIFGTHGNRSSNFSVQNSDLIISFGSRLDTKSTGSPINTFARGAKKIVIDIDQNELNKFSKFGLHIDLLIKSDLKDFFNSFFSNKLSILPSNISFLKWIKKVNKWKKDFENFDEIQKYDDGINPYEFVDALSDSCKKKAKIFIDTGCSIAWIMQRFKTKSSQRLFHDFNNTAMGWALPASIGGYFADPKNTLITIIGDGSLMMTLQELATISHHKIPIKLILINNNGYSMIKQTQDQWLSSNYYASSPKGGLSFPEYKTLAKSFNMKYLEISTKKNLKINIRNFLKEKTPVFCNVVISPKARVIPQVKFGRPNEDMDPLLPRNIFRENMIVPPLKEN